MNYPINSSILCYILYCSLFVENALLLMLKLEDFLSDQDQWYSVICSFCLEPDIVDWREESNGSCGGWNHRTGSGETGQSSTHWFYNHTTITNPFLSKELPLYSVIYIYISTLYIYNIYRVYIWNNELERAKDAICERPLIVLLCPALLTHTQNTEKRTARSLSVSPSVRFAGFFR